MKDLIEKHYNREVYNPDMGKALETWSGELERLAENTQYNYKRGVSMFLEHLGTDLDGLYEMKLADIRSDDPRDSRRVERLISQYMFQQAREGYSARSAGRIGVAVGHFIRSQGLTFTLLKNDWPKGESIGQRMILKDQIREAYEKASAMMRTRNRALMMFAKDTGLRISDIEQLNVEHYQDARSLAVKGEVFKEFKPIITKKTKALAFICIGPESVEAVDLYLEERKTKREDPLFLDYDGARLKVTALSELFRRFGKLLDDGDRISAHSFRKYNETMMESAGIPLNWIKRYQGRKVSDSTGPYSNPQQIPDRLISKYVESYDSLRVFTEKKELETVKQELTEYKVETDTMRYTQQKQISDLEARLDMVLKLVEEKAKA